MTDVDYNKKNLERCMCLSCPVQIDSVCANERKLKVLDMLANYEEGSLLMEPSQIAALYCSIGKSGCGDIDTEQMCQCMKCPVFKENSLTNGYFCKFGKK